jgi:hypothetical protein
MIGMFNKNKVVSGIYKFGADADITRQTHWLGWAFPSTKQTI